MRRSLLGKLLTDPNNVLMKSWRLDNPCPYCGAPHNFTTCEQPEPPEPGNACICSHCLGVCQFGPNLELVATTIEKLLEQGHEREEIERVMNLVRRAESIVFLKSGGSA